MFSSLISALWYTKIMLITPGGAWESCELRKISNIELKFLTIKPIHQKQLPGSVL